MGRIDEKDDHSTLTNMDEKNHRGRSMTNSSTEADLFDERHSTKEAGHSNHSSAAHHKETDQYVGTPDIDHDEIEEAVPGHELDVELAKGRHDLPSLQRLETRNSIRSKVSRVSRVISGVSRRSKKPKDRIPFAPLPLSDLDAGIVGWDSQDDPAMPLNFPQRKKWIITGLLSAITLVTPFASSILAPGISSLSAEFHNTNGIISTMTVSIYLLGYVIGPLFLAPLSEIYGRKPILGAANVFFCLWQIGCALAPNISALIVFRFFSGVGGSGCLTLGAGVISDVFRTDERGFAIGIYTLGPLIGPTIGPLIGGYLAQSIGWRWDFWIVLIVGVTITTLTEIFNSETNPRVLIERKVARLAAETGRTDLRSVYVTSGPQPSSKRILLNGLTRPMKMLFLSPMVFFMSLYIAFTYGVLYLLFTTIPVVFEETYGWSIGTTGLVYIALGAGNMAGWAIITLRSDKDIIRRTRNNDGVFEPEMRLPISVYFGALLPITFFWYGWTTQAHRHWISAVLALFPFSFGIIGVFLPITTYLVDCYPMYAASAIAANTVLRSLVGMLLPLAGPSMYRTLGLGWGNSLLGFLCIAMIPVPLLMIKFGARLRKAQKFVL